MTSTEQSTIALAVNGRVATVTLNRPQVANTMNLQFGVDLLAVARKISSGSTVRAVVLTGAGKSFSFGGDLRGMVDSGDAIGTYLKELTTNLHAAIALFMRMDAPVIVAVNGTAAGAALGLVLMGDLSIAARGARFTAAYTGVALTPDAGNSFLLPRAVGYKRAMELLLTNRVLSAEEALQWGIVNQVLPDDEVLPAAMTLASKLAAGPIEAFGAVKRLLGEAEPGLEAQLGRESAEISSRGETDEAREGIAAFLEKRTPRFV
jgi:2-(1,2-epoxy-1,2-dihydrophenyl)acetyl-CoA isomerase